MVRAVLSTAIHPDGSVFGLEQSASITSDAELSETFSRQVLSTDSLRGGCRSCCGTILDCLHLALRCCSFSPLSASTQTHLTFCHSSSLILPYYPYYLSSLSIFIFIVTPCHSSSLVSTTHQSSLSTQPTNKTSCIHSASSVGATSRMTFCSA